MNLLNVKLVLLLVGKEIKISAASATWPTSRHLTFCTKPQKLFKPDDMMGEPRLYREMTDRMVHTGVRMEPDSTHSNSDGTGQDSQPRYTN